MPQEARGPSWTSSSVRRRACPSGPRRPRGGSAPWWARQGFVACVSTTFGNTCDLAAEGRHTATRRLTAPRTLDRGLHAAGLCPCASRTAEAGRRCHRSHTASQRPDLLGVGRGTQNLDTPATITVFAPRPTCRIRAGLARARARDCVAITPSEPLTPRHVPFVVGTFLTWKARFGHTSALPDTPDRSSPWGKTQVDPPVSQTGLPLIVVPPREFESLLPP